MESFDKQILCPLESIGNGHKLAQIKYTIVSGNIIAVSVPLINSKLSRNFSQLFPVTVWYQLRKLLGKT